MAEIVAGGLNRQRTDLSLSFEVAVPEQVVALTGVTVLTMDGDAYGLAANLAYGVTTMYGVYGTTQKDFWLSDMLRAGKVMGPRLFSVGDPMFGTKYRTKRHRPNGSLDDMLEQARFNKAHGATALKDYSNHTRAARQQLAAACHAEGLNLVIVSADPRDDIRNTRKITMVIKNGELFRGLDGGRLAPDPVPAEQRGAESYTLPLAGSHPRPCPRMLLRTEMLTLICKRT